MCHVRGRAEVQKGIWWGNLNERPWCRLGDNNKFSLQENAWEEDNWINLLKPTGHVMHQPV